MATSENKAAFRDIADRLFNRGDLSVVDEVFSPDYVEHAPVPPGFSTGRDSVKQFIPMFRNAFPDLHYELGEPIGDGEMVAGQVTATGTHRGELITPMGAIPPTGKSAKWTEIHIGRFSNGKLMEHWVEQDLLGMMTQLGLIPMPGQ